MKPLLTTIAVLCALLSPANAAAQSNTLPRALVGKWCFGERQYTPTHRNESTTWENWYPRCHSEPMVITPKMIRYNKYSFCKVLYVTRFPFSSPKELANVQVTLHCEGEGLPGAQIVNMDLSKGTLTIHEFTTDADP